MATTFEEMSLLVRVLMLEFRVEDDAWRASSGPGNRRLPQPKTAANPHREVQLELFALLAEIQTKRWE